jgi:hypothetical protein
VWSALAGILLDYTIRCYSQQGGGDLLPFKPFGATQRFLSVGVGVNGNQQNWQVCGLTFETRQVECLNHNANTGYARGRLIPAWL